MGVKCVIEERILELIKNEDKRNPLTDNDIAKLVNTTREYITQFRTEKHIDNSRKRKEGILYSDIKKIIIKDRSISDRKLCKELSLLGYDISRYSASQIKKDVLSHIEIINEAGSVGDIESNFKEDELYLKDTEDKINKREKQNPMEDEKNNNSLRKIIGYHGSLKNAISQAEAAILYPPHGLHTLLLGPSGVGKSFFAEAMYNFAVKTTNFENNASFIIFNCADYADNPQLLLSQLFGYSKGSFTGANSDKVGLVERANNGILFLDEVHRLPSEGQEILFYLLDKGKYRRLGETENNRISNVMVIAATTEDPKSALLLTFRRRIPMIIELPSINNRPINEKYLIIKSFFAQESSRVGKEIIVHYEVIRSLLLYNCPGNIGQLRSDIQVACAKGFFNSLSNNTNDVVIDMKDLPKQVPLEILRNQESKLISEDIFNEDLIINPDDYLTPKLKYDRYKFPDEIYKNIESKYYEFERQGLNKDEINKMLWGKMEFDLNKYAKNIESNIMYPKEELKNIIDENILNVVEKVTDIAKRYVKDIEENFYYCIAMHLNSTYDRLRKGKVIKNPQIDYIKREYADEYEIAKILTKEINNNLNIELPEDEIGFITMYLKTFSEKDKKVSRVAVIVLTHGHVACGMAEVANKFLCTNLAIGIEMELDESPKIMLERTIEAVRNFDEGKGCLLLVDMGSLVSFGHIITKETGILTKVIGRVDTMMVLEAVRKSLIENSNLYEIYKELEGDKKFGEGEQCVKKYLKTIITVCLTGEGSALNIKKYIEGMLGESKTSLNIIPIGIANISNGKNEIMDVYKNNNVIAVVGTINPDIENVPFISFQDILKKSGKVRLMNIIGLDHKINPLIHVLDEQLIQIRDDVFDKSEIIDEMCKLLIDKGRVKDEFTISVYKREIMGGTLFQGTIGIPHGLSEFIEKSSLAIFKLSKPVLWDYDCKVDIVIMLAVKESDGEIVRKLFDTISVEGVLNEIRKANSAKEILDVLINF